MTREKRRFRPIVLLAYLLAGISAAFLLRGTPPVRLPVTKTANGSTVTITRMEGQAGRGTCTLDLQGPSGSNLRDTYNLDYIELVGTVEPWTSFRCWSAHSFGVDFDTSNSSSGTFLSALFPPSWARLCKLRIAVPRWPKECATSISFTVPSLGEPSLPLVTSTGNGITLTVSSVQWGNSHTTLPSKRVLSAHVDWSGYSYSGFNGHEIVVEDEHGHVIPTHFYETAGTEGGSNNQFEVWLNDPRVRRLRIRAFTEKQVADATEVFEFDRLPLR